ncbi:MAG: ABC transporter substrate-binding protein [Bacteriovoracaceae bacterium]|nr:ABC transporter substrate-binding protein [Bacteriovoracaceae bacterium]
MSQVNVLFNALSRKSVLALSWICVLSLFLFSSSCTKKNEVGENVLKIRVPIEFKGFDPIEANDLYSSDEIGRVYEALLEQHYLKRPFELKPNLAEAMPEVSTDGLTYTFKLKKGVMFHDDKCFPNGAGRELVAKDVEYSLRRLADPKLPSLGFWIIDGKIKGLNEWRDKSKSKDKTDYDEAIEGIKVVDSHTIQFVLTGPFPQFLYALSMPFSVIVAREAVEHYKENFMNHPVGTGPFLTGEYVRSNKLIYTRNPKYRDEFYPSEGEESDKASGLLADAGKKLPIVDKIEVSVIVEDQPAWLNFLRGEIDFLPVPKDEFTNVVTSEGVLNPKLADKGILGQKAQGLDVIYTAFNMEDPLFKNNLNLRIAMSMAYDIAKMNHLFWNNLSIPAQSVVPPGVSGYDPNYKNPYRQYDVAKAKEYLAKAGYPDGKGLPEIEYYISHGTSGRQEGEAFQGMMKAINVNIKLNVIPWTELQNLVSNKRAQMYTMSWAADYPEAENFLKILYGPNKAPGSNGGNFDDPNFNKQFEIASVMQDTPERTALYDKANKYAGEQLPLIFQFHRVRYIVQQGWMRNYKFSEFTTFNSKYYGIDAAKKSELLPKLK